MDEQNIKFKILKSNDFQLNYYKWFFDKEVYENINFRPKSIKDLQKNFNSAIKEKNTNFYGIFFKKKFIGTFKIRQICHIKSSCKFGILIGEKKYRNQGIGTVVLSFVKKWCKKNKINRIYLGVKKKNQKALSVYKKNDFKIYRIYSKKLKLFYDLNRSKIVLGFAQINSSYGIANLNKIMSIKKSKLILNFFKNKFSDEVDYAENYKSNILNFYNEIKDFKINTKVSSECYTNKKILNIINRYKKKKLKINIFYIHDGDNFFSKKTQKLYNYLLFLKKKKLINKIGISIYDFNILKKLKKKQVDVIQVPHNIIDNRLYKYSKFLLKLNCEIYVRSIYLQGSLLNKINNNPKLSLVYDKINALSKKVRIKKNVLCLNHVLKSPLISKIIIGFNSVSQIKEILLNNNISGKHKIKLDKDILQYVINPSKW